MERTLIAYIIMAAFVAAGIGIGLYLRHNSRDRFLLRQRHRDQVRREARAKER